MLALLTQQVSFFSLITYSLIDFSDFLDLELELELNDLVLLELPDLLDMTFSFCSK